MRLKPVVLSIDDDPVFRKAIEVVLSRLGLNIKGVSTPDEFLEAAEVLQPDLYLIDLQLEHSNGIELIKTIRNGQTPKAFIIVISGTKDVQMISNALELGANDYILKPLDRVLLATKLSQFVDTNELREHRAEWKTPATGRAPVQVRFDGLIEEIDELGIKFTSAALVPKGTALKLESEVLGKIGIDKKGCLVTVTSTWLVPDTHRYGAYAEFDGVDPEFLQAVRHWLARQ